jgi:hypothetical protein
MRYGVNADLVQLVLLRTYGADAIPGAAGHELLVAAQTGAELLPTPPLVHEKRCRCLTLLVAALLVHNPAAFVRAVLAVVGRHQVSAAFAGTLHQATPLPSPGKTDASLCEVVLV